MNSELAAYYAERANEYDAIYFKPERQNELALLATQMAGLLEDRQVIEIACGTGYWTQFIAPKSNHITATDYNVEVLDIARKRLESHNNVSILKADAFKLNNVPDNFNGAVAAFWWSHLSKEQLREFLSVLHSKLVPGSLVVIADNNYVEGSNTPISRSDRDGNTYQIRQLSDGSKHEIMKNFPSEQEFKEAVRLFGDDIHFQNHEYFWCGWYELSA